MKFLSPSRKEFNEAISQLLGHIDDLNKAKRNLEQRVHDLERQFVTKYAENGAIAETLADVPVNERENIKVIRRPKSPTAGMSWPQRREFLEKTDGMRNMPHK